MTIKQGALVKAWDDDPSEYKIGRYAEYSDHNDGDPYNHIVIDQNDDFSEVYGMAECYKNAIEIPPELAKALEELGND